MRILCEICGAPTHPMPVRPAGLLRRCRDCGHLRRDLVELPADPRRFPYGGEPTLDRVRLALTYRLLVRDGRPASVFEVGYGQGALLRRFAADGARISGTDPDQLRRQVDPVVLAAGAVHDVPVEQVTGGEPVDLVYGIHVLEHVTDPVATLDVARRLLRPGGRVCFLTPAGDSTGLRLYGDAWWMLEDPTHRRFFTADSLLAAAHRVGLTRPRVFRPVLDSLSVDAASAIRRLHRRDRPRGVLASRSTVALTAITAPVVLAARGLVPRTRPTLALVAGGPE